MKVATVEELRRIEAAVNATLIKYDQMMLNAGQAAADFLRNRLEIAEQTQITILVGKGNNGGDGLVVAYELAQKTSARIRLYMLETRDEHDSNFAAIMAEGLFVANTADDHDLRLLKSLIGSADIVIDALFGIGVRLPLRGKPVQIMRAVNQMLKPGNPTGADRIAIPVTPPKGNQREQRPFILAIDCPSGIDCDSGQADVNTLSADATISFIAAKRGFFSFPAAIHIGELVVSRIGIPEDFAGLQSLSQSVTDAQAASSILPPRPVDGHKGTFGKVMVVAGSANYIGATSLAAESAYRAGAGLVTVACTDALVKTVAGSLREPTYLPLAEIDGAIAETNAEVVAEQARTYDSLLIGCGLGRHRSTRLFVTKLLRNGPLPPLTVDADALSLLSESANWWNFLPAQSIITPHAGEMARLTGLSNREVSDNRWELATQKAADWNLVIVLKGAHTLIAAPSGLVTVIPFKTDALATAGTGDVLAGLIAGLRAQSMESFDCARLGAYVHALAGLIAVDHVGSSRSVVAGDVLAALGWAFNALEAS